MISPYLAQQFSGPVSQATIDAAKAQFDKTQFELDYMYEADIDTIQTDFLYYIGVWCGLPWPLAPEGTFDEDMLVFGQASAYPESSALNGFNAGLFFSTSVVDLVRVPRDVYLKLLKAWCKMRVEGVSVRTIESLVSAFSLDYTISYNADKDLVFTFLPNIAGSSLFALRILLPVVTVSPQVMLVQG